MWDTAQGDQYSYAVLTGGHTRSVKANQQDRSGTAMKQQPEQMEAEATNKPYCLL